MSFERARMRQYRPEDLARLLAFVGMCNARTDGCGYIHPGDVRHFLTNTLRGVGAERHIGLYEDDSGELLAAALIYPYHEGAFAALVHPDQRGTPLEEGVIEWCEEQTLLSQVEAGRQNSEDIRIGTEVMDCDPVRQDILRRRGYVDPGEPYLMHTTRSLEGPLPEPVLPEGFTIRSVAGEHEAGLAAAVHNSAFRPKWQAESYLQVMRAPGFDIDHELVVVAPDGQFAAFLIYWPDPVSRSGLFEPVGCHADFRRLGLTKALMFAGMRRMVERGMRTAMVLHETANAASTALYASAGFRPRYAISDYRTTPLVSES